MKKLALSLALSLALLSALCGAAAAQSLEKLADKLSEGLKDRQSIKLAVMEFPYAGGKASEGPVVVQERLTTALAQNKKVTLIERGLLKKVMGELNLQASGAFDDETVKKLGKMLGADAVVTGTLNDLKETKTEINARVVETGTGRILCAASLAVKKTWKDSAAAVTQPPVNPPPQDYGSKPLVQVALLLDTSNSMDGLINQARAQLWKIVSELVSSEKSGSKPLIEVALYEYGNSGLPAGSGWIRRVLPFTTDMDLVSRELFALRTNGGDEYCGQVIKEAVEGLKWSPKTDVYKAIFIAGNEPFTQGPVPFQAAVAAAKAKSIFVNTIYCGSRQQGLAEQWKAGADLAEGDYNNIDQSLVAQQIAAPQDDRIAQLSARLSDTYVSYGSAGKAKMAEKKEMEVSARSAGSAVYATRAAFQAAAAPAQAASEASWDAVSAIESGSLRAEEVKSDQLPEEVRKLDKAGQQKYLEQKLAERRKIKEEINALQAQRKAYLAAEEKKQAGANTLDRAMIDSIRKQATQRGYQFAK